MAARKKAGKKPTGKKPGRPPTHDRAAVMARVCERVSAGQLVKHAAELEGVNAATVRGWAAEDAELGALYARAREAQAHAMAEEALAIADSGMANDSPMTSDYVSALRLRVDTRKWLASKIAPRSYGEKLTTEHTGEVKHEHRGTLRWGDVEIPL